MFDRQFYASTRLLWRGNLWRGNLKRSRLSRAAPLVAEEAHTPRRHDAAVLQIDDRRLPELRTLSYVDRPARGAEPAFPNGSEKARVVFHSHHDLTARRRGGCRSERTCGLHDPRMHTPVYDAVRLQVPRIDVPLDDDLVGGQFQDLEAHSGRPAGVHVDGIRVVSGMVGHGTRIALRRRSAPDDGRIRPLHWPNPAHPRVPLGLD
jgi:hypothetical protein